jgi:hypothetical protein
MFGRVDVVEIEYFDTKDISGMERGCATGVMTVPEGGDKGTGERGYTENAGGSVTVLMVGGAVGDGEFGREVAARDGARGVGLGGVWGVVQKMEEKVRGGAKVAQKTNTGFAATVITEQVLCVQHHK